MEKLIDGYALIEGPVFDPDRGLIFSEVVHGGVYCLGKDGKVSTVFEHRRGIGGIARHEAGGVVVSGRNVSFKSFEGGPTVLLLDSDPEHGNVGYNDMTTDSEGRIYVGSLGKSPVFEDGREPQPGVLYLIDLDGSSRMVAKGILLTNGLGFSLDGRTLYHSDSLAQTVWVYGVSGDGSLTEKQPFTHIENGAPDGLAVSEDGAIWVAIARGGQVAVFNPNGRRRESIAVPLPMVASVCFGGEDLRDLYIVTGAEGSGSERGGAVFRMRTDVAGLRVPPAKVRISQI
jgi:gluconolactonase